MYKNAKYIKDTYGDSFTSIQVDINDITSYVPLDPSNADYQNIMRLVKEGTLTISDGNNE